jgi:LacI family transcriptional regulator
MTETTKTLKPSRVTIKHVATLAGVSTATVSHVINNKGSFSQATKRRVEAAIQRAEWTPNLHARKLATVNGAKGNHLG